MPNLRVFMVFVNENLSVQTSISLINALTLISLIQNIIVLSFT